MDRFSLMSFIAAPPLPSILHVQTFCSEGAQFQILSLLHCYTNRLAGARGQFAIGVCVCHCASTHTHIHSGRRVCHTPRGDVSMWKSLGDVSSYVSLCLLFVSHKIKLATFESHGKGVQCLLKLQKQSGFWRLEQSPPLHL